MSTDLSRLSRRERQIMDILYKHGKATALRVMEDLLDSPGYSAVRTLLGVLERKGYVKHNRDGHRYTYFPVTPTGEARTSALAHLMNTFFHGSAPEVVSALIDVAHDKLTPGEYDEIIRVVEASRREGR
jgi:predicted transcriptional regulator